MLMMMMVTIFTSFDPVFGHRAMMNYTTDTLIYFGRDLFPIILLIWNTYSYLRSFMKRTYYTRQSEAVNSVIGPIEIHAARGPIQALYYWNYSKRQHVTQHR